MQCSKAQTWGIREFYVLTRMATLYDLGSPIR
jgi:hypothetical protein